MARDSGKPSLHPPDDSDGDTRVAPRPMRFAATPTPTDDGETRVAPIPEGFGQRPLSSQRHPPSAMESETTVAPSPLQKAPAPMSQSDIETTMAPSPLLDPRGTDPRVHTSDSETRVGPVPDAAARAAYAASEFQDQQTRVAPLPDLSQLSRASRSELGAPDDSGAAPPESDSPPIAPRAHKDDEDDATRVGPLPQTLVPPDDSKSRTAPPANELFKHERRNIPAVDLPADLRLPSFEFKASDSPDVAAAKAAGVHAPLPEHLQLPTFPDLGKPPVANARTSVPPPVPKKAAPPALPKVAEPAAPVIDMSLPEFTPRPTQRNLTLIGASKDAKKALSKRLMWPTIVAGICLTVAVSFFLAREQVVSVLAPKRAALVAPPPTPQERAKTALAAGGLAYVAKDYQVAIHHFEQALTDDPRLVEAHRSLGIVYATLHDQAKAVRHYQDYLALSPHAPDATEVFKIIEDYKHAQAKAAAAPSAPAAPEPKHHKPAHGRHR